MRGEAHGVLPVGQRRHLHDHLRGRVGDHHGCLHRRGPFGGGGEVDTDGGIITLYLQVYAAQHEGSAGAELPVDGLGGGVGHGIDHRTYGRHAVHHHLHQLEGLAQELAHGVGDAEGVLPGFELSLLAFEGPLHVDEVLAYAVHHALALGDGLHLMAVGHVEDVEDRAVLVLGTCGHDACGDVRVIQCSGDARLGGVVALALGEQVIVQVCVENDLFCHGIPLLSDYCRQRTGFGVRMRGQIREKRGQISEKCSLLRLPPVLGGGDSQYFLEDT